MWGKRGKGTRINDYKHQTNTFNYIVRHKKEGAWVWTYRDPAPEPSPYFAKHGLVPSKLAPGSHSPPTEKRSVPTLNTMLPLPQLLAELVRRPSVNPMGRTDLDPAILYEARVTAFLEHELRNLGCECRRQTVFEGRDNLVATYTPPHPAPFHVLFEAHQDTVPVDGMIVEPFAAKVEGGRLYGRGACDVKAGGAVMLSPGARRLRA
jgi:hypothetical protein